jgi:hypothetical protein
MEWTLGRKLAVLLLLPIAGCGDGGEATSNVQDVQDPAALLIQKADLPPGMARGESIPEPCSPIPILEQQGAEVAGTPIFSSKDSSVAEVVGVLPSVVEAQQALVALEARERMLCIQATIENFGPKEGDSVTVGGSEPRAEGDEGSMVEFHEVDSTSEPLNSTAVVSLRSGRCIATMLFVNKAEGPDEVFIDRISGRVHERLEDAASSCR